MTLSWLWPTNWNSPNMVALDPHARAKVKRVVQRARDQRSAALSPEAEARYQRALLKAYPTATWQESEAEYKRTWRGIGNPADQIERFRRAGIVLQPKQLEFVYACRQCDQADGPNEVGFGGARGPGKSFAVFAQIAVDDCQRFPGLKVLYLRKTGTAAQEQMTDLQQHVLPHVDCTATIYKIQFPNGSHIRIGGFKDDTQALKYQGLEYDIVVIEECTQLSERTYKTLALSNRTSKNWRARTYNTTNPLGVGHAGYKRRFIDPLRRGEETGTRFVASTVTDNRFLPQDYAAKLDALTGAELRAYRYGDWDVAAGAYFETWRHDVHVIKPLDELPDGWEAWLSSDYGYNHWNIIQLHARDSDGLYYTLDELAHRKTQLTQVLPDLERMVQRYGLRRENLPFIIGTDAFQQRGNASKTVAQVYEAAGYKVQAADTHRVEGWHRLAELLGNPDDGIEPRWLITERCRKLIAALPYLERNPNNGEDVRKVDANEDGVGGDDAPDCARYGIFTEPALGKFLSKDW